MTTVQFLGSMSSRELSQRMALDKIRQKEREAEERRQKARRRH